MNKKEVQKRVLQNGKPLALSKFIWCEKTKTFSTTECCLVLDFNGIDGCTFDTGYGCTFKTGSGCTFDTGYGCTFKTGSGCTFDTGHGCTFKTGSGCTFKTGSGCTFKTGYYCVIVRRDIFEIIQPQEGEILQLCPSEIYGHLINGKLNGVPHIIADGILSKIVNKKGDIYKVINHGEKRESYLIKRGDIYSHGKTLKEAKESLVYKLSDRDTSKYKDLTLDSTLSKSDMIQCYMTITGACSSGTKYFVDNSDVVKKEYSIKEVAKLTKGQYGNEQFKEFFNVK